MSNSVRLENYVRFGPRVTICILYHVKVRDYRNNMTIPPKSKKRLNVGKHQDKIETGRDRKSADRSWFYVPNICLHLLCLGTLPIRTDQSTANSPINLLHASPRFRTPYKTKATCWEALA